MTVLADPGLNRRTLKVSVFRYGLSVAALGVPMTITTALKGHPDLSPIISASFLVVISGVAWWAGAWGGILASCLAVPALTGAATGGKAWLPPHIDFVGISIFCFISILVAKVADIRKQIEQVLRRANAELEGKIQERTIALRRSNAALENRLGEIELLYAQLPVGVCLLDQELRYLRINEHLAAMNRASVADHLNRPVRDILPAEIAKVVEPLYRAVLETGEQVVNFEVSVPETDDGCEQTQLIDCCAAKASDGSIMGLQVIVQDITERKRSEQLLLGAHADLATREREFRSVVNAIPQICWVSNADGSVSWYNDRWFEYTGIKNDLSEGWETYVAEDMLPALRQTWEESIKNGTGFEMEIPIRGADGQYRFFLARTVAIRDEVGDIRRWFGTSTDIDDLKRSRETLMARERELLLANSDLQQFAYSASHDLQEPIRTVAVYSEILERRFGNQLDAEGQKLLRFVGAGAKRMQKLVRDLLLYVETAHADKPVRATIDSSDALRDALANLKPTLETTTAEILMDPLPQVRILSTHLQQIFQNLISNSLKYRSAEPPMIHISAGKQNRTWVFSVRDNGIGIDPAYKERIFGIFKRLHTSDRYSGTGMGLAICQRIVERYGGSIWVNSEPEKGATFFFSLPE